MTTTKRKGSKPAGKPRVLPKLEPHWDEVFRRQREKQNFDMTAAVASGVELALTRLGIKTDLAPSPFGQGAGVAGEDVIPRGLINQKLDECESMAELVIKELAQVSNRIASALMVQPDNEPPLKPKYLALATDESHKSPIASRLTSLCQTLANLGNELATLRDRIQL